MGLYARIYTYTSIYNMYIPKVRFDLVILPYIILLYGYITIVNNTNINTYYSFHWTDIFCNERSCCIFRPPRVLHGVINPSYRRRLHNTRSTSLPIRNNNNKNYCIIYHWFASFPIFLNNVSKEEEIFLFYFARTLFWIYLYPVLFYWKKHT